MSPRRRKAEEAQPLRAAETSASYGGRRKRRIGDSGELLEEEGPESGGIGVYSESGLHASLKESLAGAEGRFEVPIDGKIVDLVRPTAKGEELVEVQTRRLDKIAPKVIALSRSHRLRVVHPVAAETTILRLSPETGEILSSRKSPKRGDLYSVFDELVRATSLVGARNVVVEVLLVSCREIRCRDGSGSWRRRGDKILARDLDQVLESRSFTRRADWLKLIPKELEPPYTSAGLGEALGIGADRARKILYTYAAAGLLVEAGKAGRRKLYAPLTRRREATT